MWMLTITRERLGLCALDSHTLLATSSRSLLGTGERLPHSSNFVST